MNSVKNKRILITGGAGSFGKLFVKKLLRFSPDEVVVFSRDENKQGFMESEFHDTRIRYVLGDIRDYRSVRNVMQGVDIVIHAAALKWITQVEYNVWQGVQTNIVGAQHIIDAAREAGVKRVIALSTDKAVDPINAYGMTKALQERLMTTANLYQDKTATVFVSTRYGNVLGSSGSVVPLFTSQIQRRLPLTITDRSMTRFVMTLNDSVDLVMAAMEHGVGGEVFVKKMPAHTVGDLVDVLTEHSPKYPIKILGARPGEKYHETLINESESIRTVDMGEYFVILPQISLPAVHKKYGRMKRLREFRYSSDIVDRISKKTLKSMLKAEGWL